MFVLCVMCEGESGTKLCILSYSEVDSLRLLGGVGCLKFWFEEVVDVFRQFGSR